MKLNIAFPAKGTQLNVDVEDETKTRHLFDKRLGQEFAGDLLGEQFQGYIFKITGGSDKDGFPMKQGVLLNSRVKLLLDRGSTGFQAWRARKGERRRRTVRGCIVGPDISVLSLAILKMGKNPIEGLTDKENPRRLGPKRASKLRKLFGLSPKDDVRAVVMRKKISKKAGKEGKKGRPAKTVCPKIQRLMTPTVLARRKAKKEALKARWEKAAAERAHYQKRLDRIKSSAQNVKLLRRHQKSQKLIKALAAQQARAQARQEAKAKKAAAAPPKKVAAKGASAPAPKAKGKKA